MEWIQWIWAWARALAAIEEEAALTNAVRELQALHNRMTWALGLSLGLHAVWAYLWFEAWRMGRRARAAEKAVAGGHPAHSGDAPGPG